MKASPVHTLVSASLLDRWPTADTTKCCGAGARLCVDWL